jgi:signal peptide peptidase SppA
MRHMIRSWLACLPIKRLQNPPPVVAVLSLTGTIGSMGRLRSGLSLASLAGVIERAFSLYNLKAVALVINSPGGSPVQSALIYKRIRALAEENDIPVIAFVEDVSASGGYWLACAGDEIFANESSVVGSIGVISSGFGFPQLLERFGIERRVHTTGKHKSTLDPFRPEDPDDVKRLKALQADIHESFKEVIRTRRGKQLKAPEKDLFSGEFWSGSKALELGLIDGIGDLRSVMRERYGEKLCLQLIVRERAWARRLFRFGSNYPTSPLSGSHWIDELLTTVEERSQWGRYGL